MMRNLKPNGQSFSEIEVTNLSPFGFVDRRDKSGIIREVVCILCVNGEAKYLIILVCES